MLAGLDEAAPREVAPVVPPLSCGGAVLEQLVHEVEWVVSSGADWDLNNVILMILEAIYRSEVFDRVLFCLVNPDRSVIQGRIGLGRSSTSDRM